MHFIHLETSKEAGVCVCVEARRWGEAKGKGGANKEGEKKSVYGRKCEFPRWGTEGAAQHKSCFFHRIH